MDQWSPVAISIAMKIHWYHPDVQHCGIEAILRQTQSVAHIIGSRHLAKSIKPGRIKCRILNRNSIDVIMGKIQNVNFCIARPFLPARWTYSDHITHILVRTNGLLLKCGF